MNYKLKQITVRCEMKASRKIIAEANKIASKYCRWCRPIELQTMYAELAEIGITTGIICNGNRHCEWYLNGEEIDNSLFVYSVYKDYNHSESKNEYTIYFS